jgi:predicted transcriptional regulator YheO
MHPILQRYCTLVSFLGKTLGSDYEVVLQDLTDGKNTVIAIANSAISGRSIGAPLTDLGLQFISQKTYEKNDYIINYGGQSKQHTKLRSSTMFIKDDDENLIGMLCINFNLGKYNCIVNNMKSLTEFFSSELLFTKKTENPFVQEDKENSAYTILANKNQENKTPPVENFSQSITDTIHDAITKITGQDNIQPKHLTQEEKIQIVKELNIKGIFLIKGAISEVALQLASSETSIYRYLSKLKKS